MTAFLVLLVSASLLPDARMRDAQAAVNRADLALASRLTYTTVAPVSQCEKLKPMASGTLTAIRQPGPTAL